MATGLTEILFPSQLGIQSSLGSSTNMHKLLRTFYPFCAIMCDFLTMITIITMIMISLITITKIMIMIITMQS